MGKTIGIIAIKGGVGKTTIAASLASDLVNHFGKKVLLVDANYSAPNLGLHMDIVEPEKTIHEVLTNKARTKTAIHNRYGVDVIPGSYIFEEKLNPFWIKNKIGGLKDHYDFIILDSSPNLNDELLSTINASDELFVVSTPDYPTLSCSLKAAKIAKQRGRPIRGIILNKIREPKFELSIEEIEEVAGIPVVAKIPDDKTATRAIFTRIPISIYNKKSKFSKEINNFSSMITNTKEKKPFFNKMFSIFKKEEVNRQIVKENYYTSQF